MALESAVSSEWNEFYFQSKPKEKMQLLVVLLKVMNFLTSLLHIFSVILCFFAWPLVKPIRKMASGNNYTKNFKEE